MAVKRAAAIAMVALMCVSGLFAGGTRDSQTGQAPTSMTIKPGVLMVGMEIGYPPMEYMDVDGRTPIGFDVDMAKALAAALGLEVEFVDTAWDGIFAGVNTGKYDCIISSVTITDERLEVFNFTKPYIGNTQSMVLLRGSSVRARSPEELSGLGVAYQAETTSHYYMSRLAEAGLRFIPYEYDTVMNCFDDLRNRRVDAIVCDSVVALSKYYASPDGPFEVVWEGSADEFLGICIRKGNDLLTAELDRALEELFANGTMLQLSQASFNMDMVSSVRP